MVNISMGCVSGLGSVVLISVNGVVMKLIMGIVSLLVVVEMIDVCWNRSKVNGNKLNVIVN